MMRHIKMLVVAGTLALTFTASGVLAQQPQHQHDDKQPPASSTTPGMPGPGSDPHMEHHMDMCRQMMGHGGMMVGGMGPAMMDGMMMSGDPKQRAEMMAMRGEMMKAMGEIMLKYAQRMQSGR